MAASFGDLWRPLWVCLRYSLFSLLLVVVVLRGLDPMSGFFLRSLTDWPMISALFSLFSSLSHCSSSLVSSPFSLLSSLCPWSRDDSLLSAPLPLPSWGPTLFLAITPFWERTFASFIPLILIVVVSFSLLPSALFPLLSQGLNLVGTIPPFWDRTFASFLPLIFIVIVSLFSLLSALFTLLS